MHNKTYSALPYLFKIIFSLSVPTVKAISYAMHKLRNKLNKLALL